MKNLNKILASFDDYEKAREKSNAELIDALNRAKAAREENSNG